MESCLGSETKIKMCFKKGIKEKAQQGVTCYIWLEDLTEVSGSDECADQGQELIFIFLPK